MEWYRWCRNRVVPEWGVLFEVLAPLELGLNAITLKLLDWFSTGNSTELEDLIYPALFKLDRVSSKEHLFLMDIRSFAY
jgi:hypothetical protein